MAEFSFKQAKNEKADTAKTVSAFILFVFRLRRLSLAELRSLTSLMQTVLLAFLGAGIAGQEACRFQSGLIAFVCDDQSAGDAVADSARLTGEAAALHVHDNVELAGGGSELKGLIYDVLQGVKTEVFVQRPLIDDDAAAAVGYEPNAGDCLLSASGAEILYLLFDFLGSHRQFSFFLASITSSSGF